METSFNGFGENAATFAVQDGVKPGMPVKMAGNGEVGPCAATDKFCGVALSVRGGYASVQLSGYVRLPYSGKAPAVGWQSLSAAADGKVQSAASGGREYLVVDANDSTCGFVL